MSETSQSPTLEDIALEAQRLAVAAREASLALRLIGGVAVWVSCPSARVPPLARAYGDADFVGRASERKRITSFLEAEGYEADRMFNAIHGATRLNFHDPLRDRPLDILLDRFVMAHELDLRDSSSPDGLTISLADLLLTKLQVVSVNEKDLRDLIALLLDHELEPQDIAPERIVAVTRNDWGFEHTARRTLARIREMLGDFGLSEDLQLRARTRSEELDALMEAAPKTVRWKARARIGERVKWYEEPEEAR
ncbi:MAG: hypothetical protein ABR947_01640 [Solirubrobacteraceae bacterium]|jgi:hypothetical protein